MINYRKLRLYFCQFILQISGKFPGSAQAIPAEATSTFSFPSGSRIGESARLLQKVSILFSSSDWLDTGRPDRTDLYEKDLQRFFIKWLEIHH